MADWRTNHICADALQNTSAQQVPWAVQLDALIQGKDDVVLYHDHEPCS